MWKAGPDEPIVRANIFQPQIPFKMQVKRKIIIYFFKSKVNPELP
jgi:hypothetical protein